jgi:hypothetical protein
MRQNPIHAQVWQRTQRFRRKIRGMNRQNYLFGVGFVLVVCGNAGGFHGE